MNNSVVITGATGFIGKYLLLNLLSKGYFVCAVIRSEKKETELVEFLRRNNADLSNITILISGLDDISAGKFGETFYDAWFHLAWDGVNRDGINDPLIQEKNVFFSKQCLKCAKDLNCSFFADFGSRAECSGDVKIVEETMTEVSLSAYGAKKKEFYEIAKDYCKEHEMRYVHFRIFAAFGPDDHPWSLIMTACRNFLNNASMQFGACTQAWNYLDVRDIAALVVLIYERVKETASTDNTGEIINIANKESRPLKEFVMEVYDICSSSSQLSFGENVGFSSVPRLNGIKKYGIDYQEIPFKETIRDIIRALEVVPNSQIAR